MKHYRNNEMQKLKKENNYPPVEYNQITRGISDSQNPESIKNRNSILNSINAGLYGFAIVMSIIIITKLLAFTVGTKEIFELKINDVIFSFWGFLVLSFTKFVSYHKK